MTTRFVEGSVDEAAAIDLQGLEMAPTRREAALRCDREEWFEALNELPGFYGQFGPRLPAPIWVAHAQTARRFRA